MPVSTVLIILGFALFLLGIAKLSSGQSGGFSYQNFLRNFAINFGSTNNQNIKVSSAAPQAPKTDWIGLTTAAIGLATAIAGWFKA